MNMDRLLVLLLVLALLPPLICLNGHALLLVLASLALLICLSGRLPDLKDDDR